MIDQMNDRIPANRRGLAFAAACVFAVGLAGPPSRLLAASDQTVPSRLTDLMTKGRLQADLGRHQAAIEAFEAVSRDVATPAALHWEALVRLGMARRQAGDHEGSVQAFEEVVAAHGRDPEAIRFLALAVYGVVPGPERWEAIWKDVRLSVERGGKGQSSAAIVWPGASARSHRSYSGEPMTLDLKDAQIADVLRTFSNLTGLNVVLDPAERGTVTMRVVDMPWDEALERILVPHGLRYRLDGSLMRIARAEKLEAEARSEGKVVSPR